MRIATIIVVLTVLVFTEASGQDTINNFTVVNGEMYWQRVYQTGLSFDELVEQVQESGLMEGIEVAEDKIIGNMKPMNADYKGSGYSEMSIPMYVPRHSYVGYINIEMREGRYRVTIKRILLTKKYNDPISEQGTQLELEFFALTDEGEFSRNFKKKPSTILNYTFTKEFDFKELSIRDDW
jgi:hypothetical protein